MGQRMVSSHVAIIMPSIRWAIHIGARWHLAIHWITNSLALLDVAIRLTVVRFAPALRSIPRLLWMRGIIHLD
jgi:hypothetical protein